MGERIVKVGLAGFGTVGTGVAKLIIENADSIAARTGIRLQLARVVDIDTTSERPVTLPAGILTDDLNELYDDDSIQIGVEMIGGTDAAKQVQLKMLRSGKDVVTANKALLAEHGNELYRNALENGRCIAFEASCAGGMPIVSAIRTGLTANNISSMYGIVNGTCNYILSNMTARNQEFSQALAEAQEKGYAEADPTLDISGGDSAHKLAILASIAFGYELTLDDIYVEGIEGISIDDIRYGGEMGYCLKLLAIAQRDEERKISLRVHPSFIAKDCSLARVTGPFNAVSIFGHAVGELIFYGRGAGMMPTAHHLQTSELAPEERGRAADREDGQPYQQSLHQDNVQGPAGCCRSMEQSACGPRHQHIRCDPARRHGTRQHRAGSNSNTPGQTEEHLCRS